MEQAGVLNLSLKDEHAVSPRALRFGRRLAGEVLPSFGDLKRQSCMDAPAEVPRDELAPLVALLHSRPAIDAELNGQRLSPLAQLVGEERFDLICDSQLPTRLYDCGGSALPLPNVVQSDGEALLIESTRSPELAQLVELAGHIAREAPAPEAPA